MKDSKTKTEESTRLHALGCVIPAVMCTQRLQFRRDSQRLPGCVPRTDTPIYIRERGGGRRGNSIPRNTISTVIDT